MTTNGAQPVRALRERRRALGLTRTRLAETSGFESAEVARWERGEADPAPEQILIIADAVGLDDAETQAWLDAVVTVDLRGPDVEVEIIDGGSTPPDPFLPRMRPLRAGPEFGLRVRSRLAEFRTGWVTGDRAKSKEPNGNRSEPSRPAGVGPNGPARVRSPNGNGRPPTSETKRPLSKTRRHQPAVRIGREFPSVFPEAPVGDYDPAVRVYSLEPSSSTDFEEGQFYLLRKLRTGGALIGLGILLWWSVGALGQGIGDVLNLFRAPVDTGLLP